MVQIKVLILALLLCTTAFAQELKNRFEERVVASGDVEIWTETFGQHQGKPLLLIAGGTNPGVMWSDDFCQKFADQGYFVIRYDNRDVGKSGIVDYQQHPYTLDDMAQDAIAILDAYGIEKAHIVGQCMGGFISQLIAINHPERVLSLVSLMSSPDHQVSMAAMKGEDTSGYALPPPAQKAMKAWEAMKNLPNGTREEKVKMEEESLKIVSGEEGVDELELRALSEKIIDCTRDYAAKYNHRKAMFASPGRTERLRAVQVPTLVISGGSDVVLPPAHGVATAQAIPNAKLEIIPAMGHVVCKHFHDQLISLIIEHHDNR